jgi:hypothetical protein
LLDSLQLVQFSTCNTKNTSKMVYSQVETPPGLHDSDLAGFLFRASVTLTPDFEFASPMTFFGWLRGPLSLACVLHSSILQLPCAAVPLSPLESQIRILRKTFQNDAITFRSRRKSWASCCRHQLVRQGVQEGIQHSKGSGCRYLKPLQSRVPNLTAVGCAGIAELMVFHPVDTTAKRLMSNIGKVRHRTTIHHDRV